MLLLASIKAAMVILAYLCKGILWSIFSEELSAIWRVLDLLEHNIILAAAIHHNACFLIGKSQEQSILRTPNLLSNYSLTAQEGWNQVHHTILVDFSCAFSFPISSQLCSIEFRSLDWEGHWITLIVMFTKQSDFFFVTWYIVASSNLNMGKMWL